MTPKGSRGQGFKGSSDPPQNWRIKMLNKFNELKVWKKLKKDYLELSQNALHALSSIYDLEAQILLTGNLHLIEIGESGKLKKTSQKQKER